MAHSRSPSDRDLFVKHRPIDYGPGFDQDIVHQDAGCHFRAGFDDYAGPDNRIVNLAGHPGPLANQAICAAAVFY